jgi:hypothetical protein
MTKLCPLLAAVAQMQLPFIPKPGPDEDGREWSMKVVRSQVEIAQCMEEDCQLWWLCGKGSNYDQEG